MVHGNVEAMNSSAEAIFAKIDGLVKLDYPLEWKKIAHFVKVHQGTKRREYKGDDNDAKVVDMVVFDVPVGLLVPRVSEGNEVPT